MATQSPKGSLNLKDIAKAVITTVFASALTGTYQLIQSGGTFNATTLQTIGVTALSTGIAYLVKNYLSNSDGEFLKSETKNP